MLACNTDSGRGSRRSEYPFDPASPVVLPDTVDSWSGLDGLRFGDRELRVSRGRTEKGQTDWWVSLLLDDERVADDHHSRADADIGAVLAAVLTRSSRPGSFSISRVE